MPLHTGGNNMQFRTALGCFAVGLFTTVVQFAVRKKNLTKSNLTEANIFSYGELSYGEKSVHGFSSINGSYVIVNIFRVMCF